jgi:hypothetical protein
VWQHKLSAAEKAVLGSGRFPVLLIHGIKDKVAPPGYAKRLAREIGAGLALLPGAHVVMRESAQQASACAALGWLARGRRGRRRPAARLAQPLPRRAAPPLARRAAQSAPLR